MPERLVAIQPEQDDDAPVIVRTEDDRFAPGRGRGARLLDQGFVGRNRRGSTTGRDVRDLNRPPGSGGERDRRPSVTVIGEGVVLEIFVRPAHTQDPFAFVLDRWSKDVSVSHRAATRYR